MMFRNSNGSFWGRRGIESIERDQPEQRAEDVYEMADMDEPAQPNEAMIAAVQKRRRFKGASSSTGRAPGF